MVIAWHLETSTNQRPLCRFEIPVKMFPTRALFKRSVWKGELFPIYRCQCVLIPNRGQVLSSPSETPRRRVRLPIPPALTFPRIDYLCLCTVRRKANDTR